MAEAYHRALLAFPDEDVARRHPLRRSPTGFEAFKAARRHRAPARPQGRRARSGPGAAAWPSASASRRTYDEQTFVVKATAA